MGSGNTGKGSHMGADQDQQQPWWMSMRHCGTHAHFEQGCYACRKLNELAPAGQPSIASDDSTPIVDTLATVAAIEAVESIFSSSSDPAVSSSQDFTPADTSSSASDSGSSFDGFSGGDSGGGGSSGDF